MRTPFAFPIPVLMLVLCVAMLSGCVAPGPALTETEQSATVEAIQTRVVEIRAAQSAEQSPTPTATTTAAAETAAVTSDTSLTASQETLLAKLRPRGVAPELFNEIWLNSDPLKLADLRGNVVIVEFWTYG